MFSPWQMAARREQRLFKKNAQGETFSMQNTYLSSVTFTAGESPCTQELWMAF